MLDCLLAMDYDSRGKRIPPGLNVDYSEKRTLDDNSENDESCSQSESCEEGHSSCSSLMYSDSDDSSVEWESEVQENGQLYFIESMPFTEYASTHDSHGLTNSSSNPRLNVAKPKKFQGKLVRLIRRRESKRHRSNIISKQEDGAKETDSPSLDHVSIHSSSLSSLPERGQFYEVQLKVDPWAAPNLGRRATLSERLLGLVTSTTDRGPEVWVVGFVPDGLAARQCSSVQIGDKIVSVNGKSITSQNFLCVLETIKTPTTLQLGLCTQSKNFGEVNQSHDVRSSKTFHQTRLAQYISGNKSLANELQTILVEIPVAVLYLHLDGLTEGGPEEQGIVYCYPGNIKSNILCAIRGAFLTLHQLIPDISCSVPVSSSLVVHGQLTHVAFVEENRELLLLALPHSRSSLPETIKTCSELVRVLQFKYQSLSRCFSLNIHRQEVDHFISMFLARLLLSDRWSEVYEKVSVQNIATVCYSDPFPQFESLLPAAHWIPLPREAQLQVDDALSELESNDLGDMCDDHDCQRLYTVLGCCFYHKGYLLASHLVQEDLVDIHSFCRQQGLLNLTQYEPVRSLVIWRDVFPSSACRGRQINVSCAENQSLLHSAAEGKWFILIVGQKNDMLVVLLEAGGCSSRAEENAAPDAIYVEAAQDTLRHLQKTGVTEVASSWLEANLRPQVTSPDAVAGSRTSPRRVNNLLGLRLPLDSNSSPVGRQTGTLTSMSSPSMRKSSDSLLNMKRRPSPDHSGSGPLYGETSEDSTSLVASLPSDDTGPFSIKGRRADREHVTHQASSDNEPSEDSDSDWEGFNNQSNRRLTSTTDLSDTQKSLVKKIEETLPSKLTHGMENAVFHYVHVDVSEGILLCPTVPPSSYSCTLKDVVAKFRSCAIRIHSLLQNTISFKKLKVGEVSQSHINKSLVAIKEFGALFECTFPSRGNEKTPRSFTYWVVGRLFFMPMPREVYVCYHDEAPQNMVELAFRLSLSTVG